MASKDEVSANQFLAQAAAEKVAVLRARRHLAERGARAAPGDLAQVLTKAGTVAPVAGDELPEGWAEDQG